MAPMSCCAPSVPNPLPEASAPRKAPLRGEERACDAPARPMRSIRRSDSRIGGGNREARRKRGSGAPHRGPGPGGTASGHPGGLGRANVRTVSLTRRFVAAIGALGCCWGLLSCTAAGAGREKLALEPCRLRDLGVPARCGTLRVPENRGDPAGREIELAVAVVPARPEAVSEPLFLLAGGPGQAARGVGPALLAAVPTLAEERDVVLVDQRGTGGSGKLDCPAIEGELERRLAPRVDAEETRNCLQALAADPTQYTTAAAMEDLDAVRDALGYSKIHLWGGSYGTRAALVYARLHPDRVSTLILDGLAPLGMALPSPVAAQAQAALDALLRDCRRDEPCAERFPRLEPQLVALMDRLTQSPISASFDHPTTGRRLAHVPITLEGFLGLLTGLLYSPELSALLPLGLERASAGNWQALAAAAEAMSSSLSLAEAMHLSVICSEDVPLIPADEAAEGTFLGSTLVRAAKQQCLLWPRAELPPEYFLPIASPAPALLLSGELDPVTAPRWGERVAERLPRSRHVVVAAAGHGVSSVGCVPQLIEEFLETRDAASLDASCAGEHRRPPFVLSEAGQAP